jgi:hypothetical protein
LFDEKLFSSRMVDIEPIGRDNLRESKLQVVLQKHRLHSAGRKARSNFFLSSPDAGWIGEYDEREFE